MPTILVVDDMAIFRDPIAASLRLAGFETLCATNGQEALNLIKVKLPDVILLDLAMPVMDGLSFLTRLRVQPNGKNLPVILLTAVSEKKIILQAAQYGVRDYLLKSRFSLAELMTRVRKHLSPAAANEQPASETSGSSSQTMPTEIAKQTKAAPAAQSASPASQGPTLSESSNAQSVTVPSLLTREECIRRAQTVFQAKSLSGVVTQVISLAASPRGDLSLLAGLISKDPMLSARVLQVANSAAYVSSRGPVTALPDAIRQIGTTTVRNLAAALGIFDAMPSSSSDGFDPIRCWQHSFAVGLLCERLAAPIEPDLTGAAYLVGLCHDLGEILFRTQFAEEYQKVLQFESATGKRRDELERIVLGMTQDDLVVIILQCLKLPETIRRPIELLRQAASTGDLQDPLGRILRLANLYSHGLLLASSGAAPLRPITVSECKTALKQPMVAGPDPDTFRSEIYMLTGMLVRSPSHDESKLMAPLFGKTSARVYLARQVGLSTFDPIETALKSLADVTVKSELPKPADLDNVDALVITAPASTTPEFTAKEIAALLTAKPNFPTLWLTGKADVSSTTPVQPQMWPITLDALNAFVKSAVQPASRASKAA